MTLLHINFPPDAGPLFFFLLEPFPTLSPFFSKGNRIVTARPIFHYPYSHGELEELEVHDHRFVRIHEVILLENFSPLQLSCGKN